MAKAGEKNVESYLQGMDLWPQKIEEGEGKTPDYKVFNNNRDTILFFCEEKTLQYKEFVGLENDTSEDAIKRHIRKAFKQFEAVNKEHNVPNVLIFNNLDTMINPHDLFITVSGYAITENGEILKLHNVGRIEEKLKFIDLYLWLENGEYVNHIWSELNDEHDTKLKTIFSGYL
ncbi:hypothetical protein FQ085_10215 [Planococcus sp. ANT_H30]|uniref:hypothetical protein n=1 Tax=Planococcus sp. ANT_H30 TaxID=2597347 RepID=UPI0011ED2ADF|nr:hypothetical protein [Planococcus sp. ANT_H30]KAA0957470.1 hypothetical protein FQ085_10215 [Planococcus sp. ANT_H30]